MIICDKALIIQERQFLSYSHLFCSQEVLDGILKAGHNLIISK